MNYTIKESKSDGDTETMLAVYDGEDLCGSLDVTLYSNGPCIKGVAVYSDALGPAIVKVATNYLQENYGYPDGIFVYLYAYNDYCESEWFKEANFEFFRSMDDGARLMFHLKPPLLH